MTIFEPELSWQTQAYDELERPQVKAELCRRRHVERAETCWRREPSCERVFHDEASSES